MADTSLWLFQYLVKITLLQTWWLGVSVAPCEEGTVSGGYWRLEGCSAISLLLRPGAVKIQKSKQKVCVQKCIYKIVWRRQWCGWVLKVGGVERRCQGTEQWAGQGLSSLLACKPHSVEMKTRWHVDFVVCVLVKAMGSTLRNGKNCEILSPFHGQIQTAMYWKVCKQYGLEIILHLYETFHKSFCFGWGWLCAGSFEWSGMVSFGLLSRFDTSCICWGLCGGSGSGGTRVIW